MTNREETLIAPVPGLSEMTFKDLWRHRDLLRYLVKRDMQMAYANTAAGVFWVLLQPLATALVLTVVLGILIRVPTAGQPYPLVILAAYPFWIYFSNVVSRSANSMGANAHLLTKVYFPRVIIVLVPLVAGLLDLAVLLGVTLVAALFYGRFPQISWLMLVVPVLLVIPLALGTGLWFSLLTVHVRDIGIALPVALQMAMYCSPVLYPIALVPSDWRWLYDLNPMVGIVETSRWALLGVGEIPWYSLGASVIVGLTLLVTGIVFFRALEDATADLI
ncbi:ABC transporter permease [Polaromonas sp. YR568]|uniref:ABC transporter permease n=1 Tax=Polaromonas sp. YR568 TaxID=1855301 RepID=UPI00398C1397